MRIFCDAAQNTFVKTVNQYGKQVKFDNGGHRVGIVALDDEGNRVAEAVFVNKQCPDQFAGECFSVLKAIEVAKELGLSSITISNDRIGSFKATTKKRYAGSKYLWIASKIANENGINVAFDTVSSEENLADKLSRSQDAKIGIRILDKEEA